jgi:hypothetical protein
MALLEVGHVVWLARVGIRHELTRLAAGVFFEVDGRRH